MTTAIKVGPLHAKVAAAETEIQRIEGELKGATERIASLSARRKELEGTLREARVEEAMGRQPKRSIADVKADLAALAEDLETARAKGVGLDRLKEEAEAHLTTLKKELQDQELAWFIEKSAEVREEMHAAARALAEAQRWVIALARVMANRPALRDKAAELTPQHMIWAEISNGHGLLKQWPAMGDRRVDDDLLVGEMSEIKQNLEAL